MTTQEMFQVRCPRCNKLACKASKGSYVEIRCARCAYDFDGEVGAAGQPSRE